MGEKTINQIKPGQAGNPTGIIGKIMGKIMSIYNRKDVKITLRHLDLQPTDCILEIGFGPGNSFSILSEKITSGRIVGIDHSQTMVDMATKRNFNHVRSGKLELQKASVSSLPFDSKSFDKVFSINCIYFWENPVEGLLEIKRVLKKNGCLCITVRNTNHGRNKFFTHSSLKKMFEEANFKNIIVKTHLKYNLITAVGTK